MKKKTKSRLRNSLLVPFIIAILVCILGAAASSGLFYKFFTQALTKLDEEPIAEITFKYKTAQRKFIERNAWDRLQQHSPLYNGDTIHTSNLSEATVHFPDGNLMELSENTMAQIFVSQDAVVADLKDGEAFFDSSESERGMIVSSKGSELSLTGGSSLNAKQSLEQNKFDIQVVTGSVTRGDEVLEEGFSSVIENQKEEYSLLVLSPRPNSKILYNTKENCTVNFFWNTVNFEETDDVTIIVAQDKEFIKFVTKTKSKNTGNAKVKLPAGTYYWKIFAQSKKDSEGYFESTGKLQVIQSLPPETIAPVMNHEYLYRTQKPAVRFMWSESPYASSYKLTVATDSNFEKTIINQTSSSNSSIITTLGYGKYYWKVEPFYAVNKIGLIKVNGFSSFEINPKGQLDAPELYVPAENSMVNSAKDGGGVNFSWKMGDEAVSYILQICERENFTFKNFEKQIYDNYYKLFANEMKLKEGRYYYRVAQVDNEGNVSEFCKPRSFYAMEGVPEQHLVEPSDKYSVASNLIADTIFTWKKNLSNNWKTTFMVARDPDFKKIIQSYQTNKLSAKVPSLDVGTYYWKLSSQNVITGATLETGVREFIVLGNLDKTTIVSPTKRAVISEGNLYQLKWKPVEDADFYKVTITRVAGNRIVHEDNIYSTHFSMDMYNSPAYKDGEFYKLEVQAKSIGVPGISSRRTGLIAEQIFQVKFLKPVEIKSPSNGAIIKGQDAILEPGYSIWESVDDVNYAQFVLYKKDGNDWEEIIKVPTDQEMEAGQKIAPNKILLDTPDGIRSGEYKIQVFAETVDGFDVSTLDPKYIRNFTVTPVEPLEKATGLTANPELFDAAYLSNPSNSKKITLSWDPVKNATDYIVVIRTSGLAGKKIVEINSKKTNMEIDFASMSNEQKMMFAKGSFDFYVEAVRRIDTDKDGKLDKIFQGGQPVKSNFKTNVPTPKKAVGTGAVNPYGKE